ncbi:hypothetical protein EXIGLDRAFT_731626 [Exidia glandulosa HHB12029]|uniref:Uncharacterized protein n=1 Tax=Exidia glandulosa HHB12029 TaxID=1314781 RepID=A0A166B1L2_EXIGL|nr:hypothetical protein EXIGLDRAFT_731626 [Exidia glandulosa HHB12029]
MSEPAPSGVVPNPVLHIDPTRDPYLGGNSPISRLSRDLFCQVFEWYIPVRTQVQAMRVCRVWRDALLSTPSVWSVISNEHFEEHHDGVLTSLLARSANAKLSLTVDVTTQNWKEVTDCIEANLHRCRSLTVDCEDVLDDDGAERLTRVLSHHPALALEAFRLYDLNWQFNCKSHDDVVLFAGQAPRLDLVKMHTNLASLRHSDSLGAVQRLRFRPVNSLESLQRLLSLFTAPKILALDIDDWVSDWVGGKVTLPSSIEGLIVISNSSWPSALPLLSHINHAQLLHLRLLLHLETSLGDATALVSRVLEHSKVVDIFIDLISDSEDLINLDIFWDSHERHLYNVPLTAVSLPTVFASLTWLSLGERAFTIESGLPEAPALTWLAICLIYGRYQLEWGEASIFLLPREREPLFSCPLLRTLKISAPPSSEPNAEGYVTYIAPEMIREFMTFHLAFNDPQLDHLILEGAVLLESRSDEVAELLALVEDYSWQPGFLTPASEYDDLMVYHETD